MFDALIKRWIIDDEPASVPPDALLTVDPARKPRASARPSRLVERPEWAKVDGEVLEMEALAGELGVASLTRGELLQRLVADFLWERDVELFSYGAMKRYLSAVAEKNKAKLHWRPLRDCDVTPEWGWGESGDHDYYRDNFWECRTYDGVVPLRVLRNIKALVERFPKAELHFFVSDVSDPDPFIVVMSRGADRIPFGVWDEPGFSA